MLDRDARPDLPCRSPHRPGADDLRRPEHRRPSVPSSSTPTVVTALEVLDVRFPTSRDLDGSDAMNPEPDYSAAYVVLHTDDEDGHEGHALAFTTGRGNDVQANAIAALADRVVGTPVA